LIFCCFCAKVFKFNTILFVNFYSYFWSFWGLIQKLIASASSNIKVSGITLRSFIILNWFLYRVSNRDLVLVFYVCISSFPRSTC
jgi:hypothetical protein